MFSVETLVHLRQFNLWNHRCGDHGYKCEDKYFKTRIRSIGHREEDTWQQIWTKSSSRG
jgi:hypothetical protein